MGKNYNRDANHRTVSFLREKTILIGSFYALTGLNGWIAAWLAWLQKQDRSAVVGLVVLGFVMLAMVPVSVLDRRREMRDLFAVVGAGIVWLFFSGFVAVRLQHLWVFAAVCGGEGALLAAGLWLYRRIKTKGSKGRK